MFLFVYNMYFKSTLMYFKRDFFIYFAQNKTNSP